jgi:hypothetical protein
MLIEYSVGEKPWAKIHQGRLDEAAIIFARVIIVLGLLLTAGSDAALMAGVVIAAVHRGTIEPGKTADFIAMRRLRRPQAVDRKAGRAVSRRFTIPGSSAEAGSFGHRKGRRWSTYGWGSAGCGSRGSAWA